MDQTGFPSDETLAAYIDDTLDPVTRQRVAEHLRTCEECAATFISVSELRDELSADPVTLAAAASAAQISNRPPNLVPVPWWTVAGLAAAIFIAGITALFLVSRPRAEPLRADPMAALMAAAGPVRHIDGRVTGMAFAPRAPITRGAANDVKHDPQSWKLFTAADTVQAEAQHAPTAANLHNFGLSHLLLGNWNEAVTTLEQALLVSTHETDVRRAIPRSTDASLLADLAAAYGARAKAFEQPRDRNAAFEAAARAYELQPQSAVVLWNRAVAIEELHQVDDARAAWNDYLHVDSTSRWANEARTRIALLSVPRDADLWDDARRLLDESSDAHHIGSIVTRFPQRARQHAEEDLLPAWAHAWLQHDRAAAERSLDRTREVGAALVRYSGEAMIADCVAVIDSSRDGVRDRLAAGHEAYGRGRTAYRNEQLAASAQAFTQSERDLRIGRSAFADAAAIEGAACALVRNDPTRCKQEVDRIRGSTLATSDRYRALSARINWIGALAEIHLGQPIEARQSYTQSLDAYTALHERDNAAAMHDLLAESLDYAGELDAAYQHRDLALETLAATGDTKRRHQMLFNAAYAAMRDGDSATAELLLQRLTVVDRAVPMDACTTYTWRSAFYAQRKDPLRAVEDIAKARVFCGAIPDADVRRRALAELQFAEASAASGGTATVAIANATSALAFFKGNANHVWLAELYLQRGNAYRSTGDLDAAERDYDDGIAAFEESRRRVHASPVEETYATSAARLFDEMIALQLDRGRVAESLAWCERGRALSVAASYARQQTGEGGRTLRSEGALPLARVQASLEPGVTVVELALTGDRLVAWIIERKTIAVVQQRVDSQQLRNLAASFEEVLQHAPSLDALAEPSRQLASIVVDPWIERIAPRSTLVIIPDQSLAGIPYACLRSERVKSFLLERFACAVAPTAAMYARAADEDRARRKQDAMRLLLVDNPSFDHALHPALQTLPQAHDEARAVGRLYRSVKRLRGANATKAAFLRAAPFASIIHFAGHAVPNVREPLQSALIFATGNGKNDAESLYIHEMSDQSFRRTRLFVLSACSTAQQTSSDLTIATALVARHVPSVVGSLWDVDDAAAAELFARFHTRLRSGSSRAAALASSQLELARHADPALHSPRAWAGFELIGSASGI
jgi:CHAT domain-containing protein